MRSAFSDEYKELLDRLVSARRQAGLTQHDVATRLQKPQSFVSKYERGERRIDVIEFLAITRAIGVQPHALLRELAKRISTGGGS